MFIVLFIATQLFGFRGYKKFGFIKYLTFSIIFCLTITVLLLVYRLTKFSNIEFNPRTTSGVVSGNWENKEYLLRINSDKTFNLSIKKTKFSIQWDLDKQRLQHIPKINLISTNRISQTYCNITQGCTNIKHFKYRA